MKRAWYYCKACHEDVKNENQIKKCKCKNCEYFHFSFTLHIPPLQLLFTKYSLFPPAVIGGMMVHSVLKSQQIGQHITTDGKPIPANGGAFPLNTRKHCTTMYIHLQPNEEEPKLLSSCCQSGCRSPPTSSSPNCSSKEKCLHEGGSSGGGFP